MKNIKYSAFKMQLKNIPLNNLKYEYKSYPKIHNYIRMNIIINFTREIGWEKESGRRESSSNGQLMIVKSMKKDNITNYDKLFTNAILIKSSKLDFQIKSVVVVDI